MPGARVTNAPNFVMRATVPVWVEPGAKPYAAVSHGSGRQAFRLRAMRSRSQSMDEYLDLNLLAGEEHIGCALYAAPAQFRHGNQTVDAAQINKCSEIAKR